MIESTDINIKVTEKSSELLTVFNSPSYLSPPLPARLQHSTDTQITTWTRPGQTTMREHPDCSDPQTPSSSSPVRTILSDFFIG